MFYITIVFALFYLAMYPGLGTSRASSAGHPSASTAVK
jgi:hypothetical protein